MNEERAADETPDFEAIQAKADENWSQYLRAAAELENLRKRAQRDVENAHRYALERFVADLAPVRDSLEMGLAAAGDSEETAALREGVAMTLKQLDDVLARHGVAIVDPPKGERFDPDQHEAMQVMVDPEAAPDTVVLVVQKGLSLNGRVMRPARVIVAGTPNT